MDFQKMLNFGLFQQSHIFIYHRLYSATLHLLASARRVIVRRIGPQISTPCPRQRGTGATRINKILYCYGLLSRHGQKAFVHATPKTA